jgi:hypothetical protein
VRNGGEGREGEGREVGAGIERDEIRRGAATVQNGVNNYLEFKSCVLHHGFARYNGQSHNTELISSHMQALPSQRAAIARNIPARNEATQLILEVPRSSYYHASLPHVA